MEKKEEPNNIDNKPEESSETCFEGTALPRASILRVLQGVIVATKSSRYTAESIAELILSVKNNQVSNTSNKSVSDKTVPISYNQRLSIPLAEWRETLHVQLEDERDRQVVNLVLAITYLRQHSRSFQSKPVPPTSMDKAWKTIASVLTHPTLDPPLCHAVRSAQGFLSVALCSLIEDGNIDELFRLHVWLPDDTRSNPDHRIHSHQSFGQSWILAGSAQDTSYDVEPVKRRSLKTHAMYLPSWTDGKSLDQEYKTHQTASVIENTGTHVHATEGQTNVHTQDMTYTIPAAQFHTTIVKDDSFHATLFYFDSQRGFVKDATVLGPVGGTSFTQHRDPGGISAKSLAEWVTFVRTVQDLRRRGSEISDSGNYHKSLEFRKAAWDICESQKHLPSSSKYISYVYTGVDVDEMCSFAGYLRRGEKDAVDPKTKL